MIVRFCLTVLLFFGLVITSNEVKGQATTGVGKQSYYIKKIVDNYHYNSVSFDDKLSEMVLNTFIRELDPYGLFFYADDVVRFETEYATSIDDDIKNKTSVFFDDVSAVFKKRLIAVNEMIDQLANEKIDLTIEGQVTYSDLEFEQYPKNPEEIKDVWRKELKSDLLDELFSGDYHENPLTTTIDSVLSFQEEALAYVVRAIRYEINTFLNYPKGFESYMSSFYLDAIASSIDPHTTYFSPNEHSDFVEDLSKENYAFGFSLNEDEKGTVIIEGLVPGSAAWMSNELNKGDVVLSLVLGKTELNLETAGLDDVNLLFQGSNEDELTLNIRKANGQEKTVYLEKAPIYVDQDVIKSVILEGEQKIGYITLPDFYTDWTDESMLGCANDVAKIIVKLEKENIDGLILDLRNNGGGSVKEAIDLAGIFINYGPLAIFQNDERSPQSIKDFNKGVVYDGPLAIMVNGLSASASEIFAAAMQDYNRALIVGSNTFGKATGQIILPLDPAYSPSAYGGDVEDPSFGYLKVTTSKYYHITCSTHQLNGIKPDITLPDVYDIYDYRESQYANALKRDSVVKKVYYTALPEPPSAVLSNQSIGRLADLPYGNKLKTTVDSLHKVLDERVTFPLQIEVYKKEEIEMDQAISRLFGLIEQESNTFEVVNNQYDLRIMEMNNYRSVINEGYLERVKNDVYIEETYNVISDYIKIK